MTEISIDHISLESSDDEEVKQILTDYEITPWLSNATKSIKSPNIRLHNEIVEFYEYIRPKEEEHAVRLAALDKIKAIVESAIPDTSLTPFGSFVTKLYLPNSDVDVVMISKTHDKNQLIKKMSHVIKNNPGVFTNVEILKHARVPLIKFTEAETNVEFDVTFNEESGLNNIEYMKQALRVHPEIAPLLFIFKIFLKQRKMNNAFTGGIGSFLLFCMIRAFLRDFKWKRTVNFKGQSLNYTSMTDYIVGFLSFYGKEFDYRNNQIAMHEGMKIVRKKNSSVSFSVTSPQNPEHNIGLQAFKFIDVFKVFKNRHDVIVHNQHPVGESILKYLINPANKDFKTYLE